MLGEGFCDKDCKFGISDTVDEKGMTEIENIIVAVGSIGDKYNRIKDNTSLRKSDLFWLLSIHFEDSIDTELLATIRKHRSSLPE